MEYIIALSLMVAVGAWVVGAYLRIFHLYERVQWAWRQWSLATQHRNECVRDFVKGFSACLPAGDVLPRNMHRWEADSGRALRALPTAPREGNFGGIEHAERHLRQAVSHSLHTLENTRQLRENEQLHNLCSAVSVSQFRQDAQMQRYHRSAMEYNTALDSPGAKIVAGLFGFTRVAAGAGRGDEA